MAPSSRDLIRAPIQTVIVIGGGPAGSTAARLLADRGYDVTIVMGAHSAAFKAGETLPPVAGPLLERLGLMDCLTAGPHIRCPGNQSIFGSPEIVDFDFIFSANGIGWHLDRIVLEQQLLELARQAGVNVLDDSKVIGLRENGDGWQVTTQTFKKDADYIVDASGNSRVLLRYLGVNSVRFDKLAARVAVFKTGTTQRDLRTLIEADANGWWYSACVPNGRRIAMYFSDSDLREFRSSNYNAYFLGKLKETSLISDRLTQEVQSNLHAEFYTFACSSAYAQQVQGRNWIAVGDAVMSFDPLSSQGLWTALDGADRAVGAILGQSAGKPKTATFYSDWVQQTYSRYLQEKQSYYAMEKRWQTNMFWQRRAAAPLKAKSPQKRNRDLVPMS